MGFHDRGKNSSSKSSNLHQKKFEGTVTSLKVSFYDHKTNTWQAPIELEQEEKSIKLVRRTPARHHPHPSIYDPNPQINKGRQRDGVTMYGAKQLLKFWKQKARSSSEAKTTIESDNNSLRP